MPYATIEDVEARMGRGLAQAEREIAEYVLAAVSDAIAGEFDVPDDPPAVVRLIERAGVRSASAAIRGSWPLVCAARVGARLGVG